MSVTTSTLGAFGLGATLALWAATLALVLVAVLLGLRLRADAQRDSAKRREAGGLARAYAELSIAKAAIEARSEELEATLAGMSDGVMMLDSAFRLVQWNDRFAEMTGVPRELLSVGRPMAELIEAQARIGEFGPVDVAAEVATRIARMREGRQHIVVERTRPNGQVVELRRNPLPAGGSVTLYTDITARRRAEAAQRSADAAVAALVAQKAQFVAMVCHEVAAPVDRLLESLRLLARHLTPAGSGDPTFVALQRAMSAGETMAELMRDILDMAQLDAGQLTLREGEFALRPLVAEVIGAQQRDAQARGIVLEAEIAASVPAYLHGDGGRVRQVLTNFASNAVKYAGPGRVVVRASRLDLGAPMLRLAVADPGPRIPPAQAALLFQPFVRLEERPMAGGQDRGGAGLGLAICDQLARMMGGEVGLAPGAGGGNEFWMTLPLRPAEADIAEPRAVARARARLPSGMGRRRRALVLLVEDMLVNQVVTATTLRRDGHRVDVAASGPEALELAARRPYDVVLMDLMMPGMSGYQATTALRALPGPARNAAIFALTATNAAADRARCLKAGMRGMLSKPVDAAELSATVALGAGGMAETAAPSQAPKMAATAPAAPAEPVPTATSSLLLDARRLDALRGGLPHGVFADLARHCVVDMREQMMSLDEALDTESADGVEAAAHALAGMAANYGMPAIERRMRAILTAARAGDLPGARAAGQGGAAELERTERALELLLQLHEA